jgi:hypothetical protein
MKLADGGSFAYIRPALIRDTRRAVDHFGNGVSGGSFRLALAIHGFIAPGNRVPSTMKPCLAALRLMQPLRV